MLAVPDRVKKVTVPIFTSEFSRRLEILRAASRRLLREGRWRLLRERRRGRGQEFSDHRDYVPGDEIRHIDWSVYARLDRPKVRVYEENEPIPVTVLLDRSASMEGSVFLEARRVAAGLAYVGLCHLGEVSVLPFSSRWEAGVGPIRGAGAYPRVLDLLEPLRTEGIARLAPVLQKASESRRGIAVILSDLLEAEGWASAIRQKRGHRLILVHWEENQPDLDGDLILRDRETGEAVRRTLTPETRERHRLAWEAGSRKIREACRRGGAIYLHARPGIPFDEMVLSILKEVACATP